MHSLYLFGYNYIQKGVTLSVVKNTLLKKAMEKSDKTFDDLFVALKGNTSIMLSDTGNVPAKLIKEFRKGWTDDKLQIIIDEWNHIPQATMVLDNVEDESYEDIDEEEAVDES